jgi:hypothetical protein
MSGAELETCGDVSKDGIRGLAGGVAEWVERADGETWLAGPSWWKKKIDLDPPTRPGEDNGGRIDSGLRVVFDPVPREVVLFLESYDKE